MKFLVLLLIIFSSCTIDIGTTKHKPNSTGRIQEVESKVINGVEYSIISIDSVEYVSSNTGGLFPLIKN